MSKEKQIDEMAKSVDEALTHNVTWSSKNGVIAYSAEGIARQLFDDGYRKQSELSPCDVCQFNPPSSFDGKPCAVCPAQPMR